MTHETTFHALYWRYSKPLAAIVGVTGRPYDPSALDADLFTEHVRYAVGCLRLFPDAALAGYAAALETAVGFLTVAVYEPDPLACSQIVAESCHWMNSLYFAATVLGVI